MTRQSLLTPISVLLIGLVLIAMMLVGPSAQPSAAPRRDDDTDAKTAVAQLTAYAIQTQVAYYAPQTASAAAAAAQAQQRPTSTSTPTATQPPAATSTPTATAPVAPAALPTSPPTATPTPEPTPQGAFTCVPGQPLIVTGKGPPNAGFLLLFNKRVVSGGSVGSDGSFSIALVVGREAPGLYQVEVQDRGNRQVLRDLTCEVIAPPTVTGTPAPTNGS